MGVLGPGLFSDDTACDVRGEYRRLLEDGVSDAEAKTQVLATLLTPTQQDTVVWLALAATQWKFGRLDDDTRATALRIIDDGSDLGEWADDPELQRRRAAVLGRLRAARRAHSRNTRRCGAHGDDGAHCSLATSCPTGRLPEPSSYSGSSRSTRPLRCRRRQC